MKRSRIKHKRLWVMLIVMVLILAPVLSPGWSAINCRHQDIDLDTGRAKYTRMLYWIAIKTEIKDTPISEALGVTDLESRQGDWRRVNTFSIGSKYSPNYTFHGALSEAYRLKTMWNYQQYTPEAQAETAATTLKLWKREGMEAGANYIHRLGSISLDKVTLEDIADPGGPITTDPKRNKRVK